VNGAGTLIFDFLILPDHARYPKLLRGITGSL